MSLDIYVFNWPSEDTVKPMKRQATCWERIFAKHMYDKTSLQHTDPLKLNNKKQTTQLRNGQKIWRDISPKMKYKWLTSSWKDSQPH